MHFGVALLRLRHPFPSYLGRFNCGTRHVQASGVFCFWRLIRMAIAGGMEQDRSSLVSYNSPYIRFGIAMEQLDMMGRGAFGVLGADVLLEYPTFIQWNSR
jgi:hypothetical protein